ncbi:hypothetical protein DBV05_g9849 [Lasiodiplodia theobromae]|uniref:Bacteriophage T5 Orf172 DNA-binding domain-containing protein n=1 Tax=Lasiodiplodia theobromae TaxID=45133 RepID=A0A5N5D1E2_9PEZI|nr:hypothetical protein DBV05_g9849 [Lasiodiplodia theobromae]
MSSISFPPQLAPPLGTILNLVRGLKYGDELRCHAIEDNADHRCEELYKIRMRYLKTLLETVRQMDPPFSQDDATQLAAVLLCTKHRKAKEQMGPLVHAFTATPSQKSSGAKDQTGPRRDSMRPLDSLVQYDDAKKQLLDSQHGFRCIAYDVATGRCSSEVSKDKVTTARSIIGIDLETDHSEEMESTDGEDDEGFVDEDESFDEDDDYCEDDEGSSQQSKIRPLIHLLLCKDHSHWFWLDLYHSLWQKHIAPESVYDEEEPGQWSQQDYEATEDGGSDGYSDSQSDVSELTVGRSDNDETEEASESLDTSPKTPAKSPNGRKANSSNSATETLPSNESPSSDPPIPPQDQKSSARKSKQRSTQGGEATPSIQISETPSSESPPPSNRKKPARSPRSSLRRSSANAVQSSPGSGSTDEDLAANLDSMNLGTSPAKQPQDAEDGYIGPTELVFDADSPVIPDEAARQVEENLCNLLLQPVGPQKKKSTANIYVLRSTDRPGLVKIGITADLPINRCKQIKAQSGLNDLVIIHAVRDLENADRVERIIHCHLAPFNEDPLCKNRNYREWFRFDARLAVEIVNAWAVWMQRKPYRYRSLGDGWSAKLEELQLDGMRQNQETVQQLYERHVRWTRQV